MGTTERRLDVLRAIVSEYVRTCEPVSSKAVVERYVRGVSSATIRNDMAVLEEQGLIFQPYTSSGRVPTETGYRLFVDQLAELQPLTYGQRLAIREFMSKAVDFDDVVTTAVRLLAELTNQAAVLEYPTLSAEKLRRVEIVDLPASRLLLIVVTDAGRVEERQLDYQDLETSGQIDEFWLTQLGALRDWINKRSADSFCWQVGEILEEALEEADCVYRNDVLAVRVCKLLASMTRREPSSKMMVAGVSNVARSGIGAGKAASILDALEEQVTLLRLLHEVHTLPVQVSIGAEHQEECLSDASVVSATYETPSQYLSHVAIVGPTRMNYPKSMVAVQAVSNYLSDVLLPKSKRDKHFQLAAQSSPNWSRKEK